MTDHTGSVNNLQPREDGVESTAELSIQSAVAATVTARMSELALAITSQAAAATRATTEGVMAALRERGINVDAAWTGATSWLQENEVRDHNLREVVNALLADETMLAVLGRRDIPRLYRYLQRGGISQRTIAAITRQRPGEIHEFVRGGRQPRSYGTLVRIADGLGIPRGLMGLAYSGGVVLTQKRDTPEDVDQAGAPETVSTAISSIESTELKRSASLLIARLAAIVSMEVTQDIAILLQRSGIGLDIVEEPAGLAIVRQEETDRLPDIMERLITDPRMLVALRGQDITTVFRLLAHHRVDQGQRRISQREIARYTEQSQSEVSDIYNGREVLDYNLLVRIARGLGVPRGLMGLAYSTDAIVPPNG